MLFFKLAGHELLAAIDVVGRARQGRVRHEVYGERGDVGRSDDAADGKRGTKLIAAVFEFVAKVDSSWTELERPVGREGGYSRGPNPRIVNT